MRLLNSFQVMELHVLTATFNAVLVNSAKFGLNAAIANYFSTRNKV